MWLGASPSADGVAKSADWLATPEGAVYIEGSLPGSLSSAGRLRWVLLIPAGLIVTGTEKLGDARFWKLGHGVVEAAAIHLGGGAHHQRVRNTLSAPIADAPQCEVALPGRIPDAHLAVVVDGDRHKGVGGVPSKASRVRRSRGRPAQSAARRSPQHRPQG